MKPTPPALPGLPLLGNALDFQRDRQTLFKKGYESLGPIFTVHLGPKPAAVLLGPDYHQVFFEQTDKRLNMDKAYGFLRAMFGAVAFTASPEVYYDQRPVLHAPFKREKMARYVQIMHEEVQRWLDSLGDSGEMDLTAELTTVVQNVAAHTLMGRAFREQAGSEFWALYATLSKGMDPLLPPNLPLPKFRRRDQAARRLREILTPIILARRDQADGQDDFLQEFVNTRLKSGGEVSDELIVQLLLALMFAGHETTVGQAAWTVIQLLQHPDDLARVQQEIAEKVPYGAPINLSLIPSLEQIGWAVLETTRMHPSADILMRYTAEEIEVGDYRIPAGWMTLIAPGMAHFLPDVFAEPDRYDPQRFAPGREEDRQHRFAIIGFGGGVHKCAGMNFANNEMTIIAALLLQQFDLELLTPEVRPLYGLGATRPGPSRIRYQRKAGLAPIVPPDTHTASDASAPACPHHTAN